MVIATVKSYSNDILLYIIQNETESSEYLSSEEDSMKFYASEQKPSSMPNVPLEGAGNTKRMMSIFVCQVFKSLCLRVIRQTCIRYMRLFILVSVYTTLRQDVFTFHSLSKMANELFYLLQQKTSSSHQSKRKMQTMES